MMGELYVPEKIRKHIYGLDYKEDDVGYTDAKVLIFEDFVLKIEQVNLESTTAIQMMNWLQGKLPIPKVIELVEEDGYYYLLMNRLKGKMAEDEEYLNQPNKLVKLLANALKLLWSVDITDCPVQQTLEHRLSLAKENVEQGLVDYEEADPSTFGPDGFKDAMELYQYLEQNKPEVTPTFIHGDFTFSNLFLQGDTVEGFIDLGRSGVGDPWQDLGLCVRSLYYAFEDKRYIKLLFEELGMEMDEDKIRYYILLDELF